MPLLNIDDYEAAARDSLPQPSYDYIAGGAHDEITLGENRSAYDRWRLRFRVLTGVGQRDLATTLLGTPLSMPLAIAPTAFHKLCHPEGEPATARAAAAAGTLMVASTLATTRLEDIATASPGPKWFQLYVFRDRGQTIELVERAKAAGYIGLALTVDTPYLGRRERDARNRFSLPPGLSMANYAPQGEVPEGAHTSALAVFVSEWLDANLTWKDVEWLAQISGMPVIVKGVVRADDTRHAADHGAAAVWVSNHGGRQLDSCMPTLEALPEVAEAARGTGMEVYVDGGIRRGTDVLKALALGAQAVFIGRPVLWGLANGGAEGVSAVLDIFRSELDLAMALAGVRNVGEITRDLVVRI